MVKRLYQCQLALAQPLAKVFVRLHTRIIGLWFLLITISLCAVSVTLISRAWPQYPILVALIAVLAIALSYFWASFDMMVADLTLFEGLSSEHYLAYYRQKTYLPFYKKRLESLDAIAQARVLFYQGQFEASLECLDRVDWSSLAPMDRVQGKRLVFNNQCFLGLPIDWEQAKQDLVYAQSPLYYDSLRATYELLVLKKPNDYFEDYPSQVLLEKLYLTFYQAHNAELSGNCERAEELFQSLAAFSAEFYAVAEARRWLVRAVEEQWGEI